jgi:hypothetical protein
MTLPSTAWQWRWAAAAAARSHLGNVWHETRRECDKALVMTLPSTEWQWRWAMAGAAGNLGNVWYETRRVCDEALAIDSKSPSICLMRIGSGSGKGSKGGRFRFFIVVGGPLDIRCVRGR